MSMHGRRLAWTLVAVAFVACTGEKKEPAGLTCRICQWDEMAQSFTRNCVTVDAGCDEAYPLHDAGGLAGDAVADTMERSPDAAADDAGQSGDATVLTVFADPGGPAAHEPNGKAGFSLFEITGKKITEHVGTIYQKQHPGFAQVFLQQPTNPLTQNALESFYISVLLPGTFAAGTYQKVVGGQLDFTLTDGRRYTSSLPSPQAPITVQVRTDLPTGHLYAEKVKFQAVMAPPDLPPILVDFY